MKKIKMRVTAVVMCLTIIFASVSCFNQDENPEKTMEQVTDHKPERLRVYLNGIPAESQNHDGEEYKYYTSGYTFGLYGVFSDIDAIDGHCIYQALLEYGEKNEIEFEFVFYQCEEELCAYIEEDQKQNNLPNLVLSGRPCIDIEQWMRERRLADFSALMQDDEELNEEGYYQKILQGGAMGESQYLLPYLFNVNGFITTEDALSRMAYQMPENFTYEDAIELFRSSCEACMGDEYIGALTQKTGSMGDDYLPILLISAAKTSLIDWNQREVLVSEKEFTKVVELMQVFYAQEYGISLPIDTEEWKAKHEEKGWFTDSAYYRDPAEQINHQLVLLEGGNSWGANQWSSLLGDAIYMNSFYKDAGREMVLSAIPMTEGGGYAANMTGFGFCFEGEPYIETVYDILRYLMDYEFKIPFGFSVNRKITEKQLSMAESTNYEYTPGGGYMHTWNDAEAEMIAEWHDKWIVELSPLDKKYCDQIRETIEGIGDVAKPNDPVMKEFWEDIRLAATGEMSTKEAYEILNMNLKQYMAAS